VPEFVGSSVDRSDEHNDSRLRSLPS